MTEQQTGSDERTKRLLAMGEMAASLAHEIRNPLGSMELFCSLLKKDLGERPEQLQLAEHIHNGIKTLDRIITNALQFARDIRPRMEQVADVRSFLEEILSYLQPRANEQGARLVLECKDLSPVVCDPYLLRQVLLNLLINALEALDDGCGMITVRSSCPDRHSWTLSIIDNGSGISQADLDKAFDPFFTTKKEGTGLGLAIVHSIIRAHGGTVLIESEQGRGTKVELTIPQDK